MKYAFVEAHRHEHSIAVMCRVLRIARSGFYAWVYKPLSDRAREDRLLLELIRASWPASGGRIGHSNRVFVFRQVGDRVHRAPNPSPAPPGTRRNLSSLLLLPLIGSIALELGPDEPLHAREPPAQGKLRRLRRLDAMPSVLL